MKEFDDICDLVSKLSSSERKLLLRFNRLLMDDPKENPSTILITELLNKRERNEVDLQNLLYNKENINAFRKLIQRTYDKILDIILLKHSIDGSEFYDSRSKEIFILRKKLLQIEILLIRGFKRSYLIVIEKIIKKAYNYEYYEILLYALFKKRRLIARTAKSKELYHLNNEIRKVEAQRKSLARIEESFFSILNLGVHSNHKEEIAYLERMIPKFYELEDNSTSISFKYYLYYHEMNYFDHMLDFYRAFKTADKQLKLVSKSRYFNSPSRLNAALLNKSIYAIKLFAFGECLKSLGQLYHRKALIQNDERLINEISWKCYFYLSLDHEMKLYFSKLYQSNEGTNQDRILNSKIEYYSVIQNYILNALHVNEKKNRWILTNDLPDEKWKFAQRVFQIQLLIEDEKFELADFQIENNRKFMERMKKADVLTKRQSLIGKVLIDLSRKSYDFKKVARSRQKELNLLDSVELDYRWQILSPELIVFQEWFYARLKGQNYNHKQVMAKMKEKISPVVQKPLLTLPIYASHQHTRGVSSGVKRKKVVTA